MRTKPDSNGIETFIRQNLDKLVPKAPAIYKEDGIDPVNLGDREDLLRVLKDGIYGVLWGRYSAKTRVTQSDIIKNLKARGLTQADIDAILTKATK